MDLACGNPLSTLHFDCKLRIGLRKRNKRRSCLHEHAKLYKTLRLESCTVLQVRLEIYY